MAWGRLDDRYDDTRKVKRAWRDHPRAVGLHAMSITYCCRHETDGLVDIEWLIEKLPKVAERTAVLRVLVAVGLFEEVDDDHYRVHDYLDYNPSRDQLEAKRAADAKRKRKTTQRGSGEESPPPPSGVAAEADATPEPPRAPVPPALPGPSRPFPSHFPPDPPRPVGGRQRDGVKYEKAKAEARIAQDDFARAHFPGADPDAIRNAAAFLLARRVEPTVEAIRTLLDGERAA